MIDSQKEKILTCVCFGTVPLCCHFAKENFTSHIYPLLFEVGSAVAKFVP